MSPLAEEEEVAEAIVRPVGAEHVEDPDERQPRSANPAVGEDDLDGELRMVGLPGLIPVSSNSGQERVVHPPGRFAPFHAARGPGVSARAKARRSVSTLGPPVGRARWSALTLPP
jgi:hypothetical protein